jgi:hypothetical protein
MRLLSLLIAALVALQMPNSGTESASVISGRVLNLRGQPAPGLTVNAMAIQYDDGRPQLVQAMRGTTEIRATTDDRGEYRLFGLSPGDYYLVVPAQALGAFTLSTTGTDTNRTGPDSALPTMVNYYPGTLNVNQSLAVRNHLRPL